MHDGVYWINIDYVFKGDRLTLVNQYILDGATEVDPKTYDAITPQTHEDASEGASEKNRYRNTSDLSNEVQRANASGNVPPTKFKAARSRFCWARRRFAPAKCRNALLLSSKSAKLSFSQEKLLTAHYHEPTHTPSMDMRERSGSHLRERSDEGSVRSVAMINRMTETEPQGFRQHNLP